MVSAPYGFCVSVVNPVASLYSYCLKLFNSWLHFAIAVCSLKQPKPWDVLTDVSEIFSCVSQYFFFLLGTLCHLSQMGTVSVRFSLYVCLISS